MKTDFEKMISTYTAPKGCFEVVTVPAMRFLMIDGHGDPNTSTAYEQALATLYPVGPPMDQTLHIGSYHEIYLSDPRRVAPTSSGRSFANPSNRPQISVRKPSCTR